MQATVIEVEKMPVFIFDISDLAYLALRGVSEISGLTPMWTRSPISGTLPHPFTKAET